MKKITFLFTVLFASLGFAQAQTLVNFETPTYPITNFDGGNLTVIANPQKNGINTSNTVGQMIKANGQPWGGSYFDLGTTTLNISSTTDGISMKVFVPKANVPVLFKLEDSTGATAPTERIVTATTANTWQTLQFNFSGAASTYNRMVIIFELGVMGDSTANFTYLIDDIAQFDIGTVVIPTPTVAAPAPTEAAASVISMFSGAYTNVPVDTWLTGWSSAALEDIMITGNATKKYTNVSFFGIETTTSTIDASAMTHVHFDIWTPDANDLKFKLVDFGANGVWGGDDVEHELTFAAPATGTWISYDIPLSDFTGLTTKSHLAQYIFVKSPNGILYLDNLYFYNAGGSGSECPTDIDGSGVTGGGDILEILSAWGAICE